MCRKECYDKKTAKTILNQRKREHKGEVRIYFHEGCQAWHLTSQKEYFEVVQLKEEDLVYKEKWLKLKTPD